MKRHYTMRLLLGILVVAASGCTESSLDGGGGAGDITITQPTAAPVTQFEFPVEVQLSADVFDPTTVAATLNDSALPLQGGPLVFTTLVQPGPPLRDTNVLVVQATRLGGGIETSRVEFQYVPPKAAAFRIEDNADRILGPLGHSRVGDYLLTNGVARFAIQDVGQRDLWSVGAIGTSSMRSCSPIPGATTSSRFSRR
jgi:hypothetical protein